MQMIGFIGTGNMAFAIISSIFSSRIGVRMFAYDIAENHYEELSEKGVFFCKDSTEVVKRSHYVVLAVKPQNVPEVFASIRDTVSPDTVLVSIAAGISEAYAKEQLGFSPKWIQIMPNTPLMIQKGATALAKGERVSDEEFSFIKNIFSLNGFAAQIPSDCMNEVIPINGSSPAYIYLFAKSFLDYAKQAGLDETVALDLFCASLKGSADMLQHSKGDVDRLIAQVSSPGGTTLAGMEVLQKNHFSDILLEVCEACTRRAYELSR